MLFIIYIIYSYIYKYENHELHQRKRKFAERYIYIKTYREIYKVEGAGVGWVGEGRGGGWWCVCVGRGWGG